MSFAAAILIISVLGIATAVATYLAVKSGSHARRLQQRFAGVMDAEAKLAALRADEEQAKRRAEDQRQKLAKEYDDALALHGKLKAEVSSLEENLEDMSFGFYKPRFDFSTPEQHRLELEALREKEKEWIKKGFAITAPDNWTVQNSKQQGAKMIRQSKKLFLRAFNGECDAALADVSWNNSEKMEQRIWKSADSINVLGEVLQIRILPQYVQLKMDELHLKYGYEDRKYKDREEQRRIREQIREEERAQREIEQAQSDAESDETKYGAALEKARQEAAAATGNKLDKLANQIATFEATLDEARAKKERAIARAQGFCVPNRCALTALKRFLIAGRLNW